MIPYEPSPEQLRALAALAVGPLVRKGGVWEHPDVAPSIHKEATGRSGSFHIGTLRALVKRQRAVVTDHYISGNGCHVAEKCIELATPPAIDRAMQSDQDIDRVQLASGVNGHRRPKWYNIKPPNMPTYTYKNGLTFDRWKALEPGDVIITNKERVFTVKTPSAPICDSITVEEQVAALSFNYLGRDIAELIPKAMTVTPQFRKRLELMKNPKSTVELRRAIAEQQEQLAAADRLAQAAAEAEDTLNVLRALKGVTFKARLLNMAKLQPRVMSTAINAMMRALDDDAKAAKAKADDAFIALHGVRVEKVASPSV